MTFVAFPGKMSKSQRRRYRKKAKAEAFGTNDILLVILHSHNFVE